MSGSTIAGPFMVCETPGAPLFLYRVEVDLPWIDGIVGARRPERLPIVLTRKRPDWPLTMRVARRRAPQCPVDILGLRSTTGFPSCQKAKRASHKIFPPLYRCSCRRVSLRRLLGPPCYAVQNTNS
jgi:hypothetical protein